MAPQQVPIHRQLDTFAPKFVSLVDDVVYGDIWRRRELSKRDRSLVTVSALAAMNRGEELAAHLEFALTNGVTQEELVEVLTHLAIYAGFPCAVNGLLALRRLVNDERVEAQ